MTCKLSNLIAPSFVEVHRLIRNGAITELIAKGGRGSTKSSFISIELILELLRHPNCHAIIFRQVGRTLRTSVYAQILWAISALGLSEQFHTTLNPMRCVYLPTGQQILFFGLDYPAKLKSIKVPFGYVGLAWFEELDQFGGPAQIRNVEQSLFRGGDYSFAFKSFNPPAMRRHWVNEYVCEQRPNQLVHHSTYLDVPPDWLGPRFLADAVFLKTSNEIAYRNEYLGEVIGNGEQVFQNLQIRPIEETEISQFSPSVNGIRWGYYPVPWVWNRMYFNQETQTLYIYDEATRFRSSNAETADLLKSNILQGELVIADGSEPKSIRDYLNDGLNCCKADDSVGNENYTMKRLQSFKSIVIDPIRCPETVNEFETYEYAQNDCAGTKKLIYAGTANDHIKAVCCAMSL